MSLERVISRAVSVLSQEADVASGNDVDGRLSLSSANNIQHRPVYTHPITSTEAFSSSVCGSLVDLVEKRTRATATVYVRVLAYVRARLPRLCVLAPQLSPVRVVHARNRFAAPRRFALPTFFFGPIDRRVFPLYSRSKGIGRRCSSGWQDFSLLVENRYSKFAINELFDCCSACEWMRLLKYNCPSCPIYGSTEFQRIEIKYARSSYNMYTYMYIYIYMHIYVNRVFREFTGR